jgi:hypothetical protein
MKQRCGGLLPLLAVMLMVCACSVGVGQASPSPHPPSAAPTADPARCDRLAKRGFTPCPPTADKLALPPTTIRNATNGAISDTTAQQWGRAFQLTEAYYRWAVVHANRAALTSGTLGDAAASVNLFGPDLNDIDEAARAAGTLVDNPPSLASIQLVAIPPDLQARMREQQLSPHAYGFAIRLAGPASRSVRLPSGEEKPLWSVDAQQSQSLLVWGGFKDDPDLGGIWFESGLYGCEGTVNVVCAL